MMSCAATVCLGLSLEEAAMQIYQMEHALEKLNPDMRSIEEYRAKEADYNARVADVDALTTQRDEVGKTCDEEQL